ncbi:MAG: 50S ribosomal protein L4 [Patescibacteria group bacterium]
MATKATTPAKKTAPKAKAVKASVMAGFSVSWLGIDGKAGGKVTLPGELFGSDVNKNLLAQSVRVYLANQREGGAHAKTRGLVEGSTRKIYKQKGTGKARHGSIRAPIFVGGGVVFGPVTRDFHLKLSKSMRRAALVSALSVKRADTLVMDGLEDLEPKTKNIVAALTAVGATDKVLLVLAKDSVGLTRAAQNIGFVTLLNAKDLHPYALITHKKVIFTKKALEESKAHFMK